jgi:murein DD-endopeptidase MepM/ murein hydrolase activator NlpD
MTTTQSNTLAASSICRPLQRMEIRFDGLHNVGGLRTVNGARFGWVRNGGTRAHQGVDLYAVTGTPVFAIATGEVVRIRHHDPFCGQEVMIQFRPEGRFITQIANDIPKSGTLFALYAHLSSVSVSIGAVRMGQLVGYTGTTGNADQLYPHLHFEIRTRKDPGHGIQNRINPERIFFGIDFSKPVDALDRQARTA